MNNFTRLLSYAKPHKWEFVGILILGIFSSSFQPGVVLGVKPFIEGVLVGKDPSIMKLLPIVIISFILFCAVTRYIYMVWVEYLSERIVKTVRLQLYDFYTSLSVDHYSKSSTGRMMSVMSADVQMLLEGFSKIQALFREPFTIIGLLAIAFYRDWRLTLFSLVLIPPLIYTVMRIGRKLRKMTHRRQEQWGNLNTTVHETLTGIRIVKAFNLEKILQKRFLDDNNRLLAIQFRWIKIEKLTSLVPPLIGGVALALFSYYGGTGLLTQGVSGSDLLSVGLAFGLLLDPVKKINSLNIVFQKALGAADRIFHVIDQKPSIVESPEATPMQPFAEDIVFDQVSFKYEADWILHDINLTISKGNVVAFVGSSGVGKTTIVNLIPRFYDATKGAIRIDGVDVRDFTIESLRNQIAVVSQDVFLFNDTVAANIAYGKQGADITEREILAASKAANAHDFIMKLSDGYETIIGERGIKLSGGQAQRISIARALLKNAPILILDEATSALDTESEIMVQQAIEKLIRGRTCFMIAHRLSTVHHADNIIVMDKGRFVEQGTHQKLVEKKGLYYKFYQLQFSKKLGLTDATL